MFNGDKGRLELEVVESAFRLPKIKGGAGATQGMVHGEEALPNEGSSKITLHPLWSTAQDVPFEVGVGGHGTLKTSQTFLPTSIHALDSGLRDGSW